jgi:hypothetical protein
MLKGLQEVVQVIERLPNKHEPLSSTPSSEKKRKVSLVIMTSEFGHL